MNLKLSPGSHMSSGEAERRMQGRLRPGITSDLGLDVEEVGF